MRQGDGRDPLHLVGEQDAAITLFQLHLNDPKLVAGPFTNDVPARRERYRLFTWSVAEPQLRHHAALVRIEHHERARLVGS